MPSTELETQKIETDLRTLAQDIVARATKGGATAAECVVREGDEFSTLVRLGQVETLKESGSRTDIAVKQIEDDLELLRRSGRPRRK